MERFAGGVLACVRVRAQKGRRPEKALDAQRVV